MNTISQWLDDLALLPEVDIEQWKLFRHSHDSFTCTQVDLKALLADLGEVSGWLTETGRVVQLHESHIDLQNLPLAGEFFRDDQCWQLTQLPRGLWQLTHHQLQACPVSEANCLGERVEHLQVGERNGRLRYWRLWHADANNAPYCQIALLTAIEESRA